MRGLLYMLARMMGDHNAMMRGKYVSRHIRKKGLTRSGSFWSKIGR